MKVIFALLLFVLLGCASKPVVEQTVENSFTEITLKHDGYNMFLNDDSGREELVSCIVSGMKMQVECYEKAFTPSAKELNIKSFDFKDGTTLIIKVSK